MIPDNSDQPDAGDPDPGDPDAGDPDAGDPDAGDPDPGAPNAGAPAGAAVRKRERERRRLAEIFGDVLPDSTRDDQDVPGGDTEDRDAALIRDVPPHHT